MKRFFIGASIFIISVVIVACSNALVKQTPNVITTPTPAITQDPTKGSVRATILFESGGRYLPFKNENIYITPVISDPTGQYRVTGLDRATAPLAVTDEQGYMSFANLAPGEYALIIDNVTQGWLLPETTGKGAISVKVEAGKLVDLGELKYQSLPITPVP
jgi:hypothetical protein